MKLWWSVLIVAIVLPMIISATIAENDLWEEDDKEVLVRSVRGTKGRASGGNTSPSCRYAKGEWSECDSKTNTRTRMMTLKKGESSCEKTKTMTKKCKKGKACRYEKGSWSSCVDEMMARVDNLKANSSPSCEKTRRMSKRCKPDTTNTKKTTKDRSNKKSNKEQ